MRNKEKIGMYPLPDIWSNVWGILGVVGLIFTIIYTAYSLKSQQYVDHIVVIRTLATVIMVILTVFIIMSIYYIRRLKRLERMPLELKNVQHIVDRLDKTRRYQSECSHTINHYQRNIISLLDKGLDSYQRISHDELTHIIERVSYFFVNLTTSLQHYFSQISGDTCAITIKLVNEEKNLIKTFFRDPLSLKKRRFAEKSSFSNSGAYQLEKNTAFRVIVDNSYKNLYFASDDLRELFLQYKYKNINELWHTYYNATIVVPISIVEDNEVRNLIGFLTVDNINGNLNSLDNIEYLFSVGDILYNVLNKYKRLIILSKPKFGSHEKIQQFLEWN